MDKATFFGLLNGKEGKDLYDFIASFGKDAACIETALDQYDPMKHKVIVDKVSRPDKVVWVPTNERDAEGNLVLYNDGSVKTRQQIVSVTRIALAIQQEVTDCASAILCTNKIALESKTDASDEDLQNIWDANKLDFKTLRICNIWLSETEVAELWYKEGPETKSIILANSLGNKLFPVFDDLGKLICFGRTYISQTWSDQDKKLIDVTHVEIYTDDKVIEGSNGENQTWAFTSAKSHGFKKIPVIYCSREKPLWSNVQQAIERTETTVSNLCDTNDYFGSPILAAIGGVLNFAAKGEPGKLIEVDPGGDLKYVTWDQAPESIKLELSTLSKIVSDDCKYINLSIDNLKGLFGSAPSSYAIKLLFSPAHQLAAKNEEVFGEFIQRRINFLLSANGKEQDTISPKFTYLLPRNEQEEITNIRNAKDGGFLSVGSAVKDSPLTVNAEDEIAAIKDEKTESDTNSVEQAKKMATISKPFAPVN